MRQRYHGARSLDSAAGDADFLAVIKAVRRLREAHPDTGIQPGTASEFVLGLHGELERVGGRLAGVWPAEQSRLAQQAGATVFGPAVSVNTGRSVAWKVTRAIAIIKPCMDVAEIPVHPNVGMGVRGVPIHPFPLIDAVARASRAVIEILRVDGLQMGSGDALGIRSSRMLTSGMNGMRTAGDPVMRLRMTRALRLKEAKAQTADRRRVSARDLSDGVVMQDVSSESGIGWLTEVESE